MGDGVAPQPPTAILTDTTHCPAGAACETCHAKTGLAVVIVQGALGVFCYTICTPCSPAENPSWSRPPIADAYANQVGWRGSTVDRVLMHCIHLGVTLAELTGLISAASTSPGKR